MTQQADFTPKHYIQQYLRHYAAFFTYISDGNEDSAGLELHNMRTIDRRAEKLLDDDNLNRYRMRRTALTRLFKSRLEGELRDQIEKCTIERAEELIRNFDED